MSASILHFTPRAELEPQANLEAFIELCRRSEVLSAHRQFDANVWDIGHLKGQNKVHRAIFSTAEAAITSSPEPCMAEPFLSFAKAVLVFLQDSRPVESQSVRVSAMRFLEASLKEWSKDARPTAVNEEVLDTAVELAERSVSAGVAYRIAGQLVLIAGLMQRKGFISLRSSWTHGLKKPQELGSRISKEAMKARQEKLPSAAALRALGGIFQEAVEPRDILVSSYAALMCCAPERVNEVLRLKRNCIVEGDGRFVGKLGLRWAGSKGAEDTIKWLPTVMVPVGQEAIANLLKVSAPAQQLASWYTKNPRALYLHEEATHLRGQELVTPAEIGLILWGDLGARVNANQWATDVAKLEKVPLSGRRIAYRFSEVEAAVLSMLPASFPFMPGAPELRCEDAVALARVNEMHAQRGTYLCMFTCVDYNTVANAMVAHDGQPSIFDRFKYTEDDGSPIELNTHSLRHYLNMLAQMGGMSSAEIAMFSGRKDVSQNRAYDHMTSDEVQAPIADALKAGFTATLVELPSARQIILRSQFSSAGTSAAHTTKYGWCMHDFASEPCQLHRDCINCEEQECIKGEAHKLQNLRLFKSETELSLSRARSAASDSDWGADIWVQHYTQTLERTNALIAILEDPAVPDGTRIRLSVTGANLITNDDGVRPIRFFKNDSLSVKP